MFLTFVGRWELTMAEKLDPRQVVTFEELLRAMMMEQDATRRVWYGRAC